MHKRFHSVYIPDIEVPAYPMTSPPFSICSSNLYCTDPAFPVVFFHHSLLTLISSVFMFKHAFIKILSILKKTLAISEMCAIINKR